MWFLKDDMLIWLKVVFIWRKECLRKFRVEKCDMCKRLFNIYRNVKIKFVFENLSIIRFFLIINEWIIED